VLVDTSDMNIEQVVAALSKIIDEKKAGRYSLYTLALKFIDNLSIMNYRTISIYIFLVCLSKNLKSQLL